MVFALVPKTQHRYYRRNWAADSVYEHAVALERLLRQLRDEDDMGALQYRERDCLGAVLMLRALLVDLTLVPGHIALNGRSNTLS